jgi:methylglutaconyl-CoA hydratase
MQHQTASSPQGSVTVQVNTGICTIEFGHPASNSMPSVVLQQLAQTIQEQGQNPAVKVIVLKSAGEKAFCAGASFDELVAIQNIEQGTTFFSGFAAVINAMRTCPKFIIGRIQGKAVGGGVGLASAVDYAMATQSASIKLSELAVGIGPFVVGPAVQRKLGLSAFSELSINASAWKSAEWAHGRGLYTQIFEDTFQLDHAVEQLATQLSTCNPLAMQQLKEVLWQGTEHWDTLLIERAKISGTLVLSEFTKEAIATFKAQ